MGIAYRCADRASSYKMAMQTTTKRPQSSLLRRELEETLREVDAALRAMGSGDHDSYAALWDDSPDVTLFGAWGPIERGTEAVRSTFESVGSRFGDGELVPDNVVVHMSGALACTIGFERGEVSIDGGPPQPMIAAHDARLPLHAGQVAPRAPPRRRPAARPASAARRLTPKVR